MSKSKKRKERARVLAIHKAQEAARSGPTAPNEVQTPDQPGGPGASPAEPRLSPTQENKIIASALAGNWPCGDKHKEVAVAVTVRNMGSDDGRISNGAVRNLISMEGQRMKHQQTTAGGEVVNHKHEHTGTVRVEERREFFVMLGEALRDYPEAMDRVGKFLEERVRLNQSE